MDAPLISLIVGLSTVLASGVASSFVTYRLNRNSNQTIFLRQKAEELYLSADEFGKNFASQMLTYFPLLDGKIDYNQMLDMQIERGSKTHDHGGPETMTMLVEIYFPTCRPALEKVWEARTIFNDVTAGIKRAWQRSGRVNKAEWHPKFIAATHAINDSIEALQREIVAAARPHAGVK